MSTPKTPQRMRGFSLIELMVGVVITIISSIVIFQVFSVAERQKRTVTGSSDAQVNGALSIDTIEREVRMAGFGLLNSILEDCNPATTYSYYDPGSGTPSPLGSFATPVTITDGGTGPDKITIAISGDDFDPNFRFGRTTLRSTMPQSSSELNVDSTHGCAVGDLMMMVQPCTAGTTTAGNCTLMEITHVQDSALKIQHNPAANGPSYNPPTSYQNANSWPAYQMNSSCQAYGVCMPKPSAGTGTVFSISSRQLSIQKGSGAAVAIAPEIMDMQAQYGLVSGASGTPTWQTATSTWAGSLTKAQSSQIKAIRVALIARSGEYEKPTNTAGTCDTTTSTVGLSSWATFDTTAWPSDWQCYRYKVFETVIPLRNIIWSAT